MITLLYFLVNLFYILPFLIIKKKYPNINSTIIYLGIFLFQLPVLVNSLGSYFLSSESFFANENIYNLLFLLLISFFNFLLFIISVNFISNIKISNNNFCYYFSNKSLLLILFIALGSWFVLFLNSSDWLFYPREAYQNNRKGIGFIWSLYMTFSGLYVILLYFKYRKLAGAIILTIVFGYFSGSKGYIIFGPLKLIFVSLLIYNKSISIKLVLSSLIFLIFISYIVLIYNFRLESTDFELIKQVSENYFTETYNSNLVFNDYQNGNLQFTKGDMYFSSIWKYLPRSFFPDKPLTFGSSRLVDIYFPGVSEQGTPSFGSNTYLFYDFGWFGSLIAVLKLENSLTILSFCATILYFNSKIFCKKYLFLISFLFISPEFGAQMPIFYKLIVLGFISILISKKNIYLFK
jgi:hypothetical protein